MGFYHGAGGGGGGAVPSDVRGEEVAPRHSSCEADEQSRATGCGVGGAKGGGRGECESAKHGPGTVPGKRVTGAEAHTDFVRISRRAVTPEVGAVCPNWARTDLCGGREVTRVPTAKVVGKQANRRERSLAQGESKQVSNEPRNKARDHHQHQSPVSRVRN